MSTVYKESQISSYIKSHGILSRSEPQNRSRTFWYIGQLGKELNNLNLSETDWKITIGMRNLFGWDM